MKERQQNFELLRIIAMFMIVISHVSTHYILAYDVELASFNGLLLSILRSLIFICVNVYILITGYFSVHSTKLKFRKLLNVALLPGFISVVLLIILMSFGAVDFNIWQILGKFFATLKGEYWFISNYFALYLFIPLLNKIFHALSKQEVQQLLFLNFLVGTLWSSFLENDVIVGFNSGFSLIFFVFLYFIGAYIRTYGAFFKDFNKKEYLSAYLIIGVLTGVLQFLIPAVDFVNYNGPSELIMSYCFFMFISKIEVKSIKINYIATYVLSVYLVHEQNEVRELIWDSPFIHQIIGFSQITFIPAVILVAVLVFTVSWVIGWLLTNIFEWLERTIYGWIDANKNVEQKQV